MVHLLIGYQALFSLFFSLWSITNTIFDHICSLSSSQLFFQRFILLFKKFKMNQLDFFFLSHIKQTYLLFSFHFFEVKYNIMCSMKTFFISITISVDFSNELQLVYIFGLLMRLKAVDIYF